MSQHKLLEAPHNGTSTLRGEVPTTTRSPLEAFKRYCVTDWHNPSPIGSGFISFNLVSCQSKR